MISSPATRARSSRSTAARRGARGSISRRRRSTTSSTDNAFPYRVCSGQQESARRACAAAATTGEFSIRDWHPVGVEEYGYVAPDPLDPEHRLRRQGDALRPAHRPDPAGRSARRAAAARRGDYRTLRTAPLVFSTVDPHALFFASNVVWKTSTAARAGRRSVPTSRAPTRSFRRTSASTPSSPAARARHGGVVYTVAPSYVDIKRIWAGSDDGLIHTTADGGAHWTDVTPPELRARPWSKISIMDAGRFDAQTAYAAVNTMRLDDLRPHIYRTHDGGKTWTQITNGIARRRDRSTSCAKIRSGAGCSSPGSETQVWVSFDDGDHWSSLRLNMPATSIRDLVVKDDDIAVGTHGRSFWILDDIAPLRQIARVDGTAPRHAVQAGRRVSRFAGASTPTRRFRPTSRAARIRPTARSSTTTSAPERAATRRSRSSNPTGRVIRTYSSRDTSMAPAGHRQHAARTGFVRHRCCRPPRDSIGSCGICTTRRRPERVRQPGNYPISATPHDTPP